MAFVSAVTGDDATKKFMEVLQNDFKTLSSETRKKYPQIREACDEAIEKLSLASNNPQASLYGVINQILYPLVQGCESKDLKIIKFCLGTIQRLIAQQGIDAKGARHIVDCLYNLGQAGVLELKLLQTAALLMTTSDLVHGDTLARTMVLCFRMVSPTEARDASTSHAAAATGRQLVALVFERALAEQDGELKVNPAEVRTQPGTKTPKNLPPCASDAYLILQDIIQLINGDAPNWLVGISEIPKTFGLELLDTVLTDFAPVFYKITDFRFLLKEHVCALIIRLFSPNVKYRATFTSLSIPGAPGTAPGTASPPPGTDRPHFPVSCRLLRLVSVIIHKYLSILVTECEIFLSLTIKFLDPDKPLWQRALALEVLHKMSIQPKLLASLCECYDMKPHATNIFQDIVNALGAYVQSLFVNTQANTPPGSQTLPQQAGFYWKGVWLPLCVTFEPGTAKSIYSEMLDRTEPATIQEGYGISVAYACIMELIRSIALTVEGPEFFSLQELYDENNDNDDPIREVSSKDTEPKVDNMIENTSNGCAGADQNSNLADKQKDENDEREHQVKVQLLKSSWCGLVWGLSVLAESSVGHLDNILRATQTLARICGKMGVTAGRDACILAICRCALPAQCLWALGGAGVTGRGSLTGSELSHAHHNTDYRHVLWVGTPMPNAHHNPGGTQSFVMVTSRHVVALRALLLTARRDGDILERAWHSTLTTLQHLVWILGLKPSTGGSMKASRASADSNAVISTTTVMADLPALSAMLSRVFEASKNLDDVALHHLIDALCKLSNEAMELAYSNREPSLFAVAKLLETGLANLHRIEVIWRPITNHLLEVCQHPHIRMREWGVEAITYLVQAAFQYHHANPNLVTDARSRLLLEPLAELCSVRHPDVRSRQLECAARLLHSRGEQLGAAWPLMCDIIAAISPHDSPALIRSAFVCAQVVCGDLLGVAAPRCLRAALACVAEFAAQPHDLNISLTALGCMWNISDYLYHNRDKLSHSALNGEANMVDMPQLAHLPHLDKLFICLYMKLSALCTEPRAPVRRAASQTLFSCACAHCALLSAQGWDALLAALLPMLHEVQKLSKAASADKVDTGEHILIHHSRNTAQKQWAETQVLTLSGVARVFHSRFQFLMGIENFDKYWVTLLGFITDFALWPNHEVAIAALKSFSSVLAGASRLCVCATRHDQSAEPTTPTGTTEATISPANHARLWAAAWRAWLAIADQVHSNTDSSENNVPKSTYVPSTGFITSLLQIYPQTFHHIRTTLTANDMVAVGSALSSLMSVETCPAPETLTTPSVPAGLTLHHNIEITCNEALSRPALLSATVCALSECIRNMRARGGGGGGGGRVRCVRAIVSAAVTRPQADCLSYILQTLHGELLREDPEVSANELKRRDSDMKLDSNDDVTQLAELLIQVLTTALPLARQQPIEYKEFWENLPKVLEAFMFQHPLSHQWSTAIVIAIRGEVSGTSVPAAPAPVRRAANRLLRRGTNAHSHTQAESETELRGREEFARTCFETLLQYSLLEDIDSLAATDDESDPLAIVALLDRFQEVVQRYSAHDSEYLPRNELSELSFVLKALTTLAESMKKAPPGKVDEVAWLKLIGIYPSLVSLASKSCITTAGPSLRDALMQYKDLLVIPKTK